MLELLDPSDFSARYKPKEMLSSLPSLIKSHDGSQPQAVLVGLLEKAKQCQDRGALWRIWRVANRALPQEQIEQYLFDHTFMNEQLDAAVKLLWPAKTGLNFVNNPRFKALLNGPPRRTRAEYWFRAAFIDSSLTTLDSTPEYHEFLFDQFAFQ